MPEVQKVARVQELFVKNGSLIKGYILSLLPDFSIADDVLHEVFLVVVEKAETFQEGTNFLGWACTIAKLKVLEASRSRCHVQALSPEVIDALHAAAPVKPESNLREDAHLALNGCLDKLAPQARRIIELRYRQAWRPAEIAKHLEWTTESVHVALSKARTVLRECVERRLSAENR